MPRQTRRGAVMLLTILGCLIPIKGAQKQSPTVADGVTAKEAGQLAQGEPKLASSETTATAVKGVAEANPVSLPARQVFAQFQGLAGQWRGRSTKGWAGEASFEVIAAGSVVVETSRFEAHPDETMMTIYHLDGSTMLLTHYCVAKNQPRLEMSSLSEDGKKVTFRFRDGTNLASRNQGHMDSVTYQFEGTDRFTSQWSFYKDGHEEWMEEIHYERIR